MKDVFNRAKINKASKIYEHGISMEKTAKILGITLWELAEYSGRTGVGNVNLGVTMQLNDRIKLAEEIFLQAGLPEGVLQVLLGDGETGAAIVRVPAATWKPNGWTSPAQPKRLVTSASVHVNVAWRTPQFWCIWVVLCMNVTAGIGVLGQASAMSQEMFRLSESAAAGFVGVLSLANMGGRFLWASLSDIIGRKNTYLCFFTLGILLYALVPYTESIGSVTLFVACFAVIMSMYGGGFATIPAYLRDVFGTRYVGAIHGRLLTAWSVAGILGPVLVNYLRQYQIDHGIPKAQAYNATMYLMAGLLVIGLIANALVRAVDERLHLVSDTTGTNP